MVNKTRNNFELTANILIHQGGYRVGEAYKITRQLFDRVRKERANGDKSSSVEKYLVEMLHI